MPLSSRVSPFPTIFLLLVYWYLPSFGLNTQQPVSLQEELGCSPTLSAIFRKDSEKPFFFDPLGFATDENFPRMREAELKHGRVAMVAVVGALVTTSAQEKDFLAFLTSGKTPRILQLVGEWDLAFIIQFVVFCGILETLVLVQPTPQDMPGDYGIGYWGVRDKGENERALISELENGRLSMMVILYYLVKEISEESLYQDLFQELITKIQVQ